MRRCDSKRTSIRLVARSSRQRAVLAARAAQAHATNTCRSACRVRLALASTALRTAALTAECRGRTRPAPLKRWRLAGERVGSVGHWAAREHSAATRGAAKHDRGSAACGANCWHTHPQFRRGGGRRRRAAGGAVAALLSRQTAPPPSRCSCTAAENVEYAAHNGRSVTGWSFARSVRQDASAAQ